MSTYIIEIEIPDDDVTRDEMENVTNEARHYIGESLDVHAVVTCWQADESDPACSVGDVW